MKLSDEEIKAIDNFKRLDFFDYDWQIGNDDFETRDEMLEYAEKMQKIIINLLKKQQEQIKSLKDENDFLRFMYKGTEEYEAVERYASGDHIPRID